MNDFLGIEKKKNSNTLRHWVTPFTLGAFILTALTGILLFFEVDIGLVKPVHEWLSWSLVIGAAVHILINWRATIRSFALPVAKGILLLFFVLLCASLLPTHEGGKHHPPFKAITEALLQAPLSTVAAVTKHSPDETVEILRAQGIAQARKEQTLQEIAKENNTRAIEILAMIF